MADSTQPAKTPAKKTPAKSAKGAVTKTTGPAKAAPRKTGAAAHGEASLSFKTDLILQPAEKGPERCQHSRAAADYPSIFAHNKLPVPIHIE